MIGDRITRIYVALLLLACVCGGVLASIQNGLAS
jgi:hypothetical protein